MENSTDSCNVNIESRDRVLILCGHDDSARTVDFLSTRYDVTTVNDFDQALSELRQSQFNLVVSDIGDFLPLERAAVAEQAAVILETIGQGVGILDLNCNVIWGNALLQAMPSDLIESMSNQCKAVFSREIEAGTARPGGRRFNLQNSEGSFYEVTASPVIDGDDQFKTLAIAIWDVTASRQLQQKLNAIDKAGRELVRLETEVVEKLDIPHRLRLLEEKILSYTRDVLGFDKFSLRLIDKKTTRLDIIISSGLSEQAKNAAIFAAPDGNGISGHVASTGRSYICHDVKADRRYLAGIDKAASSLTVPIMLNDQVVGVFNFESETLAAFNEDDRQIAEIFCRYVAIALHILDLMVVERHRTTGQLADNVTQEIAGPLNDILTETTSLMEEYIGQDDMRHRLQSICDSVSKVRESIKEVGRSTTGLRGAKPAGTIYDPVLCDKRILVADDEPIIRQTINDVLGKHGCEVDLAKDGEEAIGLIDQREYDLILSDIKMPIKSGYDIFATAKAKDANLPVVFMTGFGYDPNHSVIRARQEGLSGVLYKPFKVDELVGLLRDAIREAKV